MYHFEIFVLTPMQIVPGDIIELAIGSIVPADCILISMETPILVDQSCLTGECHPISKSVEPDHDSPSIFEAKNVLLSQTAIVSGSCKAMVIATGIKISFFIDGRNRFIFWRYSQ